MLPGLREKILYTLPDFLGVGRRHFEYEVNCFLVISIVQAPNAARIKRKIQNLALC